MPTTFQKKVKLGVYARQTQWAPFWVVLKKFGAGKRKHPSEVTVNRRHWRRTKLRLKPVKRFKKHLG